MPGEPSAIAAMATDEFVIVTAIAALASAAGAIAWFVFLKRSRLIQDTPTSKIRSAAQGYVELEGHAGLLDGEPVRSPLSGKHCCWWHYSVEEKRTRYSNGKRRTEWATIDSGTSASLFELEDETDACVIDPEGATVIADTKLNWYGNSRRPRGAPAKSPLFGFGRYRYKEQRVSDGIALYAIGWFRTEGGIVHTFDEKTEVRELMAEWKRNPTIMKTFDVNGDGQVDAKEWEAARRMAANKVRERQIDTAVHPDIHGLMKPPDGRLYLLSTTPQAALIKRYRVYSAISLAAFLIGGSAALWLLTERGVLG